jgi:RNA polymerase-interacting CarD/CdnL/TRCF family regulator
MLFLEKKARNSIVQIDLLKEKLNKNNARRTAQVVKALWLDKNNIATSFSPSKKTIYKKALRILCEEYALVRNTTVEKAEAKIEEALEKSIR